jgi:dTDP-4-dehydrorhamnose reductase
MNTEPRYTLSVDAARMIIELSTDKNATGLFHLPGPERLSRLEFANLLAEIFDIASTLIISTSMKETYTDGQRLFFWQ